MACRHQDMHAYQHHENSINRIDDFPKVDRHLAIFAILQNSLFKSALNQSITVANLINAPISKTLYCLHVFTIVSTSGEIMKVPASIQKLPRLIWWIEILPGQQLIIYLADFRLVTL